MKKIDYRKELKQLYFASTKEPTIVKVPAMNFLMIDGKGHPSEQEFQDAAGTIYPVAYTMKFMIRPRIDIDYRIMLLELLWTLNRERKTFRWTMLQMQPKYVTKQLYNEALEKLALKQTLPSILKLRFEKFDEGLCAQIMHKGHYEKMNETLEILLNFIKSKGYSSMKDTHDIYLNDFRKTKPENLKTIVRLKINKTL
ncbi:MAG: GyrI-like domain-containing protein [Elusimicrobiota bacterium]